jgi:hypothetical protein
MPDIEINGATLAVPEAVAAELQAVRARAATLESEAQARAEEAGRLQAEVAAKARAEAAAQRERAMDDAAKHGEVQKLKELAQAREQQYAAATLARDVRAAIASHPDVRQSGLEPAVRSALLGDLAALVSSGLRFDLDSGTPTDAAGRSVDLAAVIAAAVAARPWFAEPKLAGGTGSGDASTPVVAGGSKAVLKAAGRHLDYIEAHGHAAWAALPER